MKTHTWGTVFLIFGAALCVLGMWLLLQPPQYRATARIRIEDDVSETINSIVEVSKELGYDPNYTETELEVIKSQVVLGRVVDALDLNKEFGEIYAGGCPLRPAESIQHLKDRMDLRRVLNTQIIEVRMVDQDPALAARLANAVADAYLEHKRAIHREQIQEQVKQLKDKLPEMDEKLQKEFEELQKQSPAAADTLRKKKEKLDKMIEARQENTFSPVEIIDRAVTSFVPYRPIRPLGAVATLVGLGLAGFGGLTLFKRKS